MNTCRVLVVYHCDCMTDWELGLTAQHHESIILHITSPGKDQYSKFEVQFLLNVLSLLHYSKVQKL